MKFSNCSLWRFASDRLVHSVLVYNYDDTPGRPTRTALGMVMEFYRERLLNENEFVG